MSEKRDVTARGFSLRPRYEVWTYLAVDDQRVTEPKIAKGPFGRFWTRRAANKWGKRVTVNRDTLIASLECLRSGHMIFPEYEVRRV